MPVLATFETFRVRLHARRPGLSARSRPAASHPIAAHDPTVHVLDGLLGGVLVFEDDKGETGRIFGLPDLPKLAILGEALFQLFLGTVHAQVAHVHPIALVTLETGLSRAATAATGSSRARLGPTG
jgi:hypothetical protein